MNTRSSNIGIFTTTIGLVAAVLLLTGCTTVETERTSTNENLRSRMVRGTSSEIFELVARCVYREFPDAQIRNYPTVGEIEVTNYSLMGGDAVIAATVTGWPDGRVEVNVSATGMGSSKQKVAIGKLLSAFDRAYADWSKDRAIEGHAAE